MCGVIGFVDKKNVLSKQEKRIVGLKMLRMISHRGKDCSCLKIFNSVTIGHNRLAILDMSVNSNQPYTSNDGGIVMSYNGEIFNHLELRKLINKEIKYRSSSDTETFYHLFSKLKNRCFQKVRGMFAVSFYEQRKNNITLAVDLFGIKPLYYINNSEWFAWTSELKVLETLPGISFSIDERKLSEHAIFRTLPFSETLIKDVKRITPGTVIQYNLKKDTVDVEHYSYLNEINKHSMDELLNLSISEHLLSDVSMGIQLSGGLDSSLVSVLASKYFPEKTLHTFSIGLSDSKWNEFKYSRKVAKQIKSIHHEITFTQQNFCTMLPIVTHHLDEPISYPNTIPLMVLAQKARSYVKVLLSGEGSDEIFGGYLRYKDFYKNKLTFKKILFSNKFCLEDEVRKVFKLDHGCKFLDRGKIINKTKSKSQSYKLNYYDLKTYLPSLLLRQDKMGMAANLENRFPFLDPRLVSEALKLDNRKKFTHDKTKILLKKIAKKYLPQEIIHRKKCGFGLPIDSWLKDDLLLGKYLNLFRYPKVKRVYLDYNYIEQLITEHISNKKNNSNILWVLITLEVWVKIFIDKNNPNEIWKNL